MASTDLIADVWRHIFCYIPSVQRATLAQVCTQWRTLIQNPVVWKSVEYFQKDLASIVHTGTRQEAANKSFLNFLSKYRTAVEDLVIQMDVGPTCANFLNSIFGMRSLRRVSIACKPVRGLSSFGVDPSCILCNDLEVLNLRGAIMGEFGHLLLKVPNLKELHVDFNCILVPAVGSLRNLELLTFDCGIWPTDGLADKLRQSGVTPKLAIVTDKMGRVIAEEPVKVGNTLLIKRNTLLFGDIYKHLPLIEPLLDRNDGALLLNELIAALNFTDEELVRIVKDRKFPVNTTIGASISPFRPKYFGQPDANPRDYVLKSAVMKGLAGRVATLISLGADPNSPLHDDSPLLYATKPTIYKQLLSLGADPNKLIDGIPVFMYLLLQAPRFSFGQVGLEVEIKDVLPELLACNCDIYKKYRGCSLIDVSDPYSSQYQPVFSLTRPQLALKVNQNERTISDILQSILGHVKLTSDQLAQLFFKNYAEFNRLISRSEFDFDSLHLSTAVMAYLKNPKKQLHDIIMRQRELVCDELGLTLAHHVALAGAYAKNGSQPGKQKAKLQVEGYNARWIVQTQAPSENVFQILPSYLENVKRNTDREQMDVDSSAPSPNNSASSSQSFSVPGVTSTSITFRTQPVQAPQQTGFSFGTQTNQPQTQTGFTFGAQPAQSTEPKQSGFTFGAQLPQEQPQQTGLTFGALPIQSQTRTGFTFGAQLPQEHPQQTGFSFGTQTTQPTQSQAQTGFTFGAQPTQSLLSQITSDFSFGAQQLHQETTESQQSGFTFGAQPPQTQSQHTGFTFGAQMPQAQPQQAGLTFGAPPRQSQTRTGFTFGAQPSQMQPQQTGFTIGALPMQPQTRTGFNFGAQPVESHSNFSFQATVSKLQGDSDVKVAPFVPPEEVALKIIEEYFAGHKHAINVQSKSGESPLLLLCKISMPDKIKLDSVRSLLNFGADVNLADNHGWTPLHALLLSSEYSIAKELLAHGANINAQDALGVTPLMAWFYGFNYSGEKLISISFYRDTKLLLQHDGIDFSLSDRIFNRCVIHLMACMAPPSLVEIVLKGSTSHVVLEARDTEGLTPLHHAAMFCNTDMISYLIKLGANVNAQSYALKLTPFMIYTAILHHEVFSPHTHWLAHCNAMMLGRFIETKIPSKENSYEFFTVREPSWIAHQKGSLEPSFAPMFVRFIAHKTEFKGDSAFPSSEPIKGWEDFLNADLSLSDRYGNTLLHSLMRTHCQRRGLQTNLDDLPDWSDLDFLWNIRNAKGQTPFHWLSKACQPSTLNYSKFREFITKKQIDLLVPNNKGKTALEYFLTSDMSVEYKIEIVALAKKGSKTSIPQLKKQSQRSYLHTLFASDAYVNVSLVRSIIAKFENEIHVQDDDGNTPLMALLLKYFNDIPHLMRPETEVLKEADPTVQVNSDYTRTHLFPLMEYLITCPGADLNIQNNSGDTALHIVCRQFHVGALEAMLCNLNTFEQASKYCLIAFKLLDGGAQVMIKNNAGETAIDYAPMLMSHYQHVYPLIKNYTIRLVKPIESRSTNGNHNLSDFDPLEEE